MIVDLRRRVVHGHFLVELLLFLDLVVHFLQFEREQIQLFILVDLNHRRVRLHALEKIGDQTADVTRLVDKIFQLLVVEKAVDETKAMPVDVTLLGEIEDGVVA